MSSDGEEVSAMAYGLQLAGCRIFLVEQFSGISAGSRAIQLLATDRAKSGFSSQVETWQKLYVRCVYETRRDSRFSRNHVEYRLNALLSRLCMRVESRYI